MTKTHIAIKIINNKIRILPNGFQLQSSSGWSTGWWLLLPSVGASITWVQFLCSSLYMNTHIHSDKVDTRHSSVDRDSPLPSPPLSSHPYSPSLTLKPHDSSFRWIQSELYKKTVLALQSFIMAGNMGGDFEAYKVLHAALGAFWSKVMYLCKKHGRNERTFLDFKISTPIHWHYKA